MYHFDNLREFMEGGDKKKQKEINRIKSVSLKKIMENNLNLQNQIVLSASNFISTYNEYQKVTAEVDKKAKKENMEIIETIYKDNDLSDNSTQFILNLIDKAIAYVSFVEYENKLNGSIVSLVVKMVDACFIERNYVEWMKICKSISDEAAASVLGIMSGVVNLAKFISEFDSDEKKSELYGKIDREFCALDFEEMKLLLTLSFLKKYTEAFEKGLKNKEDLTG